MIRKELILSLWAGLLSLSLIGQQGVYLGEDEMPDPLTSISPMQDYGELGNFDGGYHIGDYCADFTAYDHQGNNVSLSNLLNGDKPVIISSSSITCGKFTDCFNVFDPNPGNQAAREYMKIHADDFEWVFIYGVEAHPADTTECASNCPPLPYPAPNGEFIEQHETYQDRQVAAQLWLDINSSVEYSYDFPHHMWIDNPNNGVYNTFFARPFGCVVLNCEGMVIERGIWTSSWLAMQGGIEFLDSLLEEPWATCEGPECTENSLDSDGDGICDELELFDGSDPDDPCSPNDSDLDQDGFCDMDETINGTDPEDPCDPDDTDTDNDGYCDILENLNGWDPLDVNDPDGQVGIGESNGAEFNMFPNPTTEILNVNATVEIKLWQLMDMSGRVINTGRPFSTTLKIDMTELESGTYLLLIGASSEKTIQKVVRY